MESIDKLRSLEGKSDLPFWAEVAISDIADEIEREIAERYIELPVDGEGVLIHVGDVVAEYPYRPKLGEKPSEVVCMLLNSDGWAISDRDPSGTWWHSYTLEHAKPRTIEDVLRECCNEWNKHCGDEWESGVYAKYADELRSMGVDE